MTGRGLRGRRQARLMLFFAFMLVGLEVSLFVAAPTYMGPMFVQSNWVLSVQGLGIAAQAIGLVWMIRIYRADPEEHPSSFRVTRH
jgi:hypothetical protein